MGIKHFTLDVLPEVKSHVLADITDRNIIIPLFLKNRCDIIVWENVPYFDSIKFTKFFKT